MLSYLDHLDPAEILSGNGPTTDRARQGGEEKYPSKHEHHKSPPSMRIYCGCRSCFFWHLKDIDKILVSTEEQSVWWQINHALTCKDELTIDTGCF